MHHKPDVRSASFSPDNSRILIADGETARIWDAKTSLPVGVPMRHEDSLNSASFSPDGTRVVTASDDKTARIWNAETGRAIGGPMEHKDSVKSASFSPDGTRVVTSSYGKSPNIWDAKTGVAVGVSLESGTQGLASFSPDGTRIVTAGGYIFDAKSCMKVGVPLKHKDRIIDASFSSDGARVVTASSDKTACIWEVRTKETLDGELAEDLAAICSGFRLDRVTGTITRLLPEQMRGLLESRRAILSAPSLSDWRIAVARHSLDSTPETTLVSPHIEITVRQLATTGLRSMDAARIREAGALDPGHPLVPFAFAEIEARDEEKIGYTLPANRERAAWLREYGIKHLPAAAAFCIAAAEMLERANLPDLAKRAYERATEGPADTDGDGMRARAIAFGKLDRSEEQLATRQKIITLPDATAKDFQDTSYLAAKLGKGDIAHSACEQAMQRFPKDESIPRLAGWVFINLADHNSAVAAFRRAESLLSKEAKPSIDLLNGLSLSLWLHDENDAAMDTYKKLIEREAKWATPDSIKKQGWPEAEAKPMEAVRAATLKKYPELAPKAQ